MTDAPEVCVSPHETRPGALVYRARSTGRVAVSVRTTRRLVDYIRVGSGAWGGRIEHGYAVVLAETLARAITVAEDESTLRGRQYFRARSAEGTPVCVRIDGPVRRYPEFTLGGVDYVRVGSGSWGGSISHEPAVALHAVLRAALAGGGRR